MNRQLHILTDSPCASKVRDRLTECYGPGWDERRFRVKVEVVSHQTSRDPKKVGKWVRSVAERQRFHGHIIIIGSIEYDGPKAFDAFANVYRYPTLDSFRQAIDSHLRALGLDFVSLRTEHLAPNWEINRLTRDHVELWLNQFSKVNRRWVGERLLGLVHCYSTSDLLDVLGVDEATNEFDMFAYFSPPNDPLGSADALAQAFKKRTKMSPIRIASHVDIPIDKSTLCIEDCSISGHEFCETVDKYWPEGMHEFAEDKRLARMTFRYAVLSNGAEIVIRKKLMARGLENALLDVGRAIRIETHSKFGLAAMTGGFDQFYTAGKVPVRSDYVIEDSFRSIEHWGGEQQLKIARSFLQKVGSQLYEQHLGSGTNRTSEWIRRAGLGAGGYALSVALGRSVPKSTLPVLWARGTVTYRNITLDWVPLFV